MEHKSYCREDISTGRPIRKKNMAPALLKKQEIPIFEFFL